MSPRHLLQTVQILFRCVRKCVRKLSVGGGGEEVGIKAKASRIQQ